MNVKTPTILFIAGSHIGKEAWVTWTDGEFMRVTLKGGNPLDSMEVRMSDREITWTDNPAQYAQYIQQYGRGIRQNFPVSCMCLDMFTEQMQRAQTRIIMNTIYRRILLGRWAREAIKRGVMTCGPEFFTRDLEIIA